VMQRLCNNRPKHLQFAANVNNEYRAKANNIGGINDARMTYVSCRCTTGKRWRPDWQVAAAEGEPRSQIPAHHHVDTRRIRALLDSVAHLVARHRLLFGQRVLRRAFVSVRPVLLALLSQQPDQPVLLRAG